MSALLQILADDKNNVTYRPKINKITGSVTATILLQQILYWYLKQGEFYKFREPCKHSAYKEDDSWCEELGFTVYEFDSALKKLKDLKLVETRKTMDRKTFFSLDTTLLGKLIKPIYEIGESPTSKVEKTKPVYSTETTPETNTERGTLSEKIQFTKNNANYEQARHTKFKSLTDDEIDLELKIFLADYPKSKFTQLCNFLEEKARKKDFETKRKGKYDKNFNEPDQDETWEGEHVHFDKITKKKFVELLPSEFDSQKDWQDKVNKARDMGFTVRGGEPTYSQLQIWNSN